MRSTALSEAQIFLNAEAKVTTVGLPAKVTEYMLNGKEQIRK